MTLYIDTSTEFCRIWLDDEYFEKKLGRNMAKELLENIKEILHRKGLSWQDLEAVAVMKGAGSYTGLRIGITFANTLSDGLRIPIVGVENSENWRENAKKRLENSENDKIVMPFYGGDVKITKPRK